MPDWTFVATDEALKPAGEILQASDRSVTLNLNKVDSASFKVRLDNPLADLLISGAASIKCYRDGILQFYGPTVAAEEIGDVGGAYITVTAAGSGWKLSKRYVGKSSTGTTIASGTDKAAVVTSLLGTLNTESPTGVVANTSPAPSAGAPLSAALTIGPYEKLLDTINKLSNTLDGFDWRILPRENWANGGYVGTSTTIGLFTALPVLGTSRPGAVFEWGAGRNNIQSYNRVVNRDSQATKVFHNVAEGPDAPGYPTVSSTADAATLATWGLLEEIADADLHDATLRQALTDAHIAVRKNPKQTITFVPHIDPALTGRLPNFDQDYTIGDTVVARARYAGVTRFNINVRVYAVKFDIDSAGVERATLTLVQEA